MFHTVSDLISSACYLYFFTLHLGFMGSSQRPPLGPPADSLPCDLASPRPPPSFQLSSSCSGLSSVILSGRLFHCRYVAFNCFHVSTLSKCSVPNLKFQFSNVCIFSMLFQSHWLFPAPPFARLASYHFSNLFAQCPRGCFTLR